jgi:hypothetical protein
VSREPWTAGLHCALLFDLDGDLDRALGMCLSVPQDWIARWRAYELLHRHLLVRVDDLPLLELSLWPEIVDHQTPLALRIIRAWREPGMTNGLGQVTDGGVPARADWT